jgi:DNA repair protein RecN (Recombination protein N)
LRELSRELTTMRRAQPLSQAEIERNNSRIALLQKLQRKYRTTLDGLIELRDRRKQELATLDNLDGELLLLSKRVQEWHNRMLEAGQALRALRLKAAKRMDADVQARIRELGMGKATFCTQIEDSEAGPLGLDRVEFLMAPNAGEGRKPLRQAVSGGELSRVLLAFKSVMAARDLIPVLVFDEVDSGISGEIAHRIGECLRDLGQSHQVLTITHLHQVACRAERHLRVTKNEQEGRTFTYITPLDHPARILEIARMLGDPKSDAVLHHAQQLLENPHAH